MTWLTPTIAIASAAVLAPALVALYFLKLKRKDVEISTTLLWKKAVHDMQANAPLQRLRRNVLLLLQLLVLAGGLLALGQPEVSREASQIARHVLLIDTSASMSTRDGAGGDSRLAQAKREADAFIDGLREGALWGAGKRDEAMVIVFSADAQVVQPFTTNKLALHRAIDAITPTDAPTHIAEALRLAGAMTNSDSADTIDATKPAAAIHIWTDGAISDIDATQTPANTAIIWEKTGGESAHNVAITAIRVARAFDDAKRARIFVGVQSVGEQTQGAMVDVELAIDGTPLSVQRVALQPVASGASDTKTANGASQASLSGIMRGSAVFSFSRPTGALLTARVLSNDALAADDVARVVLPPARRLRVALVSTGALFVRTAFEGMNLAKLVAFTPAEAAQQARDADAWSQFDVVVLDGVMIETDAAKRLPPGRYLALGVIPPIPGLAAEPANNVDAPTLPIEWGRTSALTRDAGFERLTVGKALGVRVGDNVEIRMQLEQGPGVLRVRAPGLDAIVTTFAPADSDWPFDPGFIVFLGEALRALGDPAMDTAGALTPGETIVERLPIGASDIRLAPLTAEEQGDATPLTADQSGRVVYGPVRSAGVYTLRWRGEPGPEDFVHGSDSVRPVVVNLLDARESNVKPAADLALPAASVVTRASAADAAPRRALWPALLLVALGLSLVEWWLYNRRVAI